MTLGSLTDPASLNLHIGGSTLTVLFEPAEKCGMTPALLADLTLSSPAIVNF